jgi:hypothetical protein
MTLNGFDSIHHPPAIISPLEKRERYWFVRAEILGHDSSRPNPYVQITKFFEIRKVFGNSLLFRQNHLFGNNPVTLKKLLICETSILSMSYRKSGGRGFLAGCSVSYADIRSHCL